MSEIRVNDVLLSYEERGSGEPILCIHGTGSSAALWQDAVAELARHGRTIVYDRRGFGRSERPEPFVTNVHLQADDAAALLDALDAAPAVVLGRSHGAEIAVDLALRHPDMVRALALLEGGGLSLSPTFERWLSGVHERLFAAAESDPESLGEAFVRCVLGDTAWEGLPDPVRQVFLANGPAILAEERGGMLGVDAAELGAIAQPVLVVGARESGRGFAEATELTARAIPSARVEWVDGGHLIDPAHPAVLAFVDDVLSRVATSSATTTRP
jgi:pimeloyl-ACP methyl ester carboxylesterase